MPDLTIDRAYLVQKTRELIRYPSVNPPGDVREITAAIARDLSGFGMAVEERAQDPGKPNLAARWSGRARGPVLIMYSHTDVVPVDARERERWVCDPFGGEVRGDVVYGRGAVDAKSKLSAMLAAAKAVRDAGIPLRGELRYLVTADGEIGDKAGLKYLSERDPAYVTGDMAVGCEPSELKILRVYKGRLWLRVVVEGTQVHSLVPETGVNAIAKTLQILPALMSTPSSQDGVVGAEIGDEMLGGASRAYTTIHGGSAMNVLPGACEATLDFRLIGGQTVAGVLADVERQVARIRSEHPDVRVTVEPIPGSARDPIVIPKDAPVVRALQRAYRRATGEPVAFGRGYSSGGLGAFHQRGIPAVYFGSGAIWSAHRENESVTVDELVRMAATYAHLIVDVLGVEP